jgi:hypothetical protein
MLIGITSTEKVGAEELRFYATVSLSLAPLAKVFVTQAALFNWCGEQLDYPGLCFSFRAGYSVSHGILSRDEVISLVHRSDVSAH